MLDERLEAIWEEDDELFYKEATFKDIHKDCDYCIFEDAPEYCPRHIDYNSPCDEEQYQGLTLREVKAQIDKERTVLSAEQLRRSEARYNQREKVQAKLEKQQQRRKETLKENADLDEELKQIKTLIESKRRYLITSETFARIFAYAKSTLPDGTETKIPVEKHAFELEIEALEIRVGEIKLEKESRAEVRRARRKLEDK